jgi:hypothetical protein
MTSMDYENENGRYDGMFLAQFTPRRLHLESARLEVVPFTDRFSQRNNAMNATEALLLAPCVMSVTEIGACPPTAVLLIGMYPISKVLEL